MSVKFMGAYREWAYKREFGSASTVWYKWLCYRTTPVSSCRTSSIGKCERFCKKKENHHLQEIKSCANLRCKTFPDEGGFSLNVRESSKERQQEPRSQPTDCAMSVNQCANISLHKLLIVAERELLKATKLQPELCVHAQFHFNVKHLQEIGFN